MWPLEKNAPPLASHVFQANFHEDRKINVASRVLTGKNAPPPGGNVFQPTSIIFKLVQDIIGMNLLTKFHEDLTINVVSRVHIRKTALPLGSHAFQANTNLLTKFHDDWKDNKLLTAHDARWMTDKRRSKKLTMSTTSVMINLSSDNHLVDGQTDRPT
ncbi:hypothetical protein DPMN_154110 [Dreissena polymorpha]|uniref:Uncharacterized protein n=1 Tax=Dreissena polymorpha TaxID=45954 RepID=A0A9D4FR58_DREPO|nr:hypothetical protein DPMN_154110 [Dreissena polymorpha]